MARKKADSPPDKSETKLELVRCIATAAFNSIIAHLPNGNFSAFDQIVNDIGPLDLNYGEAAEVFWCVEISLHNFAESSDFEADSFTAEAHIDHLRKMAKDYFVDRIHEDTKDLHVADILVEVERQLENDSITPYFRGACERVKELCESKIARLRKRMEIKGSLNTQSNPEHNLTDREKLLAKICPMFRDATPQIQQDVWSKLLDFSRKQWALFFIEADSTKKQYSTKADAIKGIIKPQTKRIEEISGRTNMRGVSIIEGSARYVEDSEKVREIISILKADAVLRKNHLLPLTET